MKAKTAICIYTKNKEHVKWWNTKGQKLVKWEWIGRVADETTGEIVGYVYAIKGLLKRYVERKSVSFISDQKEVFFIKNRGC